MHGGDSHLTVYQNSHKNSVKHVHITFKMLTMLFLENGVPIYNSSDEIEINVYSSVTRNVLTPWKETQPPSARVRKPVLCNNTYTNDQFKVA